MAYDVTFTEPAEWDKDQIVSYLLVRSATAAQRLASSQPSTTLWETSRAHNRCTPVRRRGVLFRRGIERQAFSATCCSIDLTVAPLRSRASFTLGKTTHACSNVCDNWDRLNCHILR